MTHVGARSGAPGRSVTDTATALNIVAVSTGLLKGPE
jgi:hypothetical protein